MSSSLLSNVTTAKYYTMYYYFSCKEWMDDNNVFQQSKYMSSFMASNIGALGKTVFLTPMDVIMTRLYNQGKDLTTLSQKQYFAVL